MPEPRRSRRGAYRGLKELQARAKAVAAEETEALLSAALDDDDKSFDENDTSDGEDIIDSDFDEPEEAAQESNPAPVEPRERKRRYGKYVDPATKKPRPATAPKPHAAGTPANAADPPARKSLRRSTKAASEKAAESRAQRRKDEAVRRARREAREANKEVLKIPTQEELLAEAAETEVANRESLKELLRLEEEKKRLPPPKKRSTGPVVSTRSRDGVQTLSFSDGVDPREVMFPI